jgi:hypothetical protein
MMLAVTALIAYYGTFDPPKKHHLKRPMWKTFRKL